VIPVPFQKDGRAGLMMQAIFPRVNPDLHCGEWAPKIAPAVEAAVIEQPIVDVA
jgi:hypothetical protein